MKLRHLHQAKWLTAFAVLPFLFFNCSKMKTANFASNGVGGSALPAADQGSSDPNLAFESLPDGTLSVHQDKELKFAPGGGAVGTYAISGLPTWATFDAITGTVTGTPHKLSDGGTFTITQALSGATFGPYTVKVLGDALAEQQWHLINVGQTSYALTPGVSGEDLHYANSVKANLFGTGVRVAISDTGAVIAHPDLAPNLLAGESRNYLNNYSTTQSWLGDPTPSAATPDDAHGTAVTGLFAAKGWNGIGGRGMAPEAKFAAFLFLPAQDQLSTAGLLTMGFNDQFAGNFDIFNYSWGDPQCVLTQYSSSLSAKMAAGVTTQRGGKGSIYVMAAGNSYVQDLSDCYGSVTAGQSYVLGNNEFSELNTTPYTINVGAVNASGLSASYSSPGAALWISSNGGEFGYSKAVTGSPEASQPALVTTDYPGCNNGLKEIEKADSTFDAGSAPNADCNYTNTMNGTSGATPLAGGAAAILLQANPALTWRDVKYIFAKTADMVNPTANPATHPVASLNLTGHVYEQGWVTNTAGFHFMNWYGFGRINVDNAVTMAKAYSQNLGTFKNTAFLPDSGTISAAIPDASDTGVTRTLSVTNALTIEAVQVKISISGCAGDMGIELTSPGGTKSILMNINSKLKDGAIPGHVFLTNAFYGEPAAGTWSLKVIDGAATCTANLTNWALNVFGH